jgi:hypothetical protein
MAELQLCRQDPENAIADDFGDRLQWDLILELIWEMDIQF